HLDTLLDGYRVAQRLLAANRERLLTPTGPLTGLHDAPVRCIYRDTWSCYKVIQWSAHPSVLKDASRRERFLTRLFKAALDDRDHAQTLVSIVAAEIEAFRMLDVPLFLSRPESDSIFTSNGLEIPRAFEGTAGDRLRRRVRGLAAFPLDDH